MRDHYSFNHLTGTIGVDPVEPEAEKRQPHIVQPPADEDIKAAKLSEAARAELTAAIANGLQPGSRRARRLAIRAYGIEWPKDAPVQISPAQREFYTKRANQQRQQPQKES